MMNLVTIPNLVGGHLGGWRHKDAFARPVMNLEAFIEMTEIAERGKLDAVFLADGNGVRDMDRPALFAANHPSARPKFRASPGLDAVTRFQPARPLLIWSIEANLRAIVYGSS